MDRRPHDHEGFTTPRGIKVFAIMKPPLLSAASVTLGLLILAWPLAWAPGWAYTVAVLGALAVLAAAFPGWRPGPALAVAAAILACAFSRAGSLVLAAEGLFILGYLLAADAPAGLTRSGPWLGRQLRLCVAGLIASGAVLAALALHQVSSAALTAAGLAAAAGAYLIALPSGRAAARASEPAAGRASRPAVARAPGPDSDVDVQ
jgi:hypothetical protein